MRHQVFQGLTLEGFPRARDGEEKTQRRSGRRRRVLHHLHIGLGAVRRIALNDNEFRPGRRPKVSPSHETTYFPFGSPDGFWAE